MNKKISKPNIISFIIAIFSLVFGINCSWLSIYYSLINSELSFESMILFIIVASFFVIFGVFFLVKALYEKVIIFEKELRIVRIFRKEQKLDLTKVDYYSLIIDSKESLERIEYFDANKNLLFSTNFKNKDISKFLENSKYKKV
ncbi:MAG TPA: hypothetical protein DDW20_03445 [Firmicutes bacterium]|nr:hypothetical protein [Bacillota bacterium]